MSKSVDETVFDFFSVLLQEPSTEVAYEDVDAVEATSDQLPTDGASYINSKLTESSKETDSDELNTQTQSAERLITNNDKVPIGSTRKSLIEPISPETARHKMLVPTVKKFAQPSVDKDALSKLLSAVSKPNTIPNSVASVQQNIKDKAEQVRLKLDSTKNKSVDEKVEPLFASDNKDLKKSADIVTSVINTDSEQHQERICIPETELSSIPPSITTSLQEVLDDEFQVLFFNVAGLTLAVPLVSLGGIVKIEHINHLIGRPKWFLGVQTRRDQTVNVVDSCQWVMPEKYTKELAESVNYQYIVMLEGSDWGFACESLVNSVKINKTHVNWREKAGKRPWLAGVVKEQMCGILNVQALIEMLDAGLGCQDSID